MPGVKVTRLVRSGHTNKLGIALLQVERDANVGRNDLVQRLEKSRVYVYGLERRDQSMLASLHTMARQARPDDANLALARHRGVAPILQVLAGLRAWRREVISKGSRFAVTPPLEQLFAVLDAHVKLLRARGFNLPEKVTADPKEVDLLGANLPRLPARPLSKIWKMNGQQLAAACRAVELTTFDHYIAQLQKIQQEAAAVATRVAGTNKRAHAQHRALSTYTSRLSKLIQQATAGVRFRR